MPGRTGRWRAIATRSRCSTSATSSGQGGAGQRPLPRLRRGECLPTLAAAARAILAPLAPILAGVLAIVTQFLTVVTQFLAVLAKLLRVLANVSLCGWSRARRGRCLLRLADPAAQQGQPQQGRPARCPHLSSHRILLV